MIIKKTLFLIFISILFFNQVLAQIAQDLITLKWRADPEETINNFPEDRRKQFESEGKEHIDHFKADLSDVTMDFKKDGSYISGMSGGIETKGTWRLSEDGKALLVFIEGSQEMKIAIEEISPNKLVLDIGSINGTKSILVLIPDKNEKTEQAPNFPGGLREFYKYVAKNIKYPDEARRAGIQGRVLIQFFINEQGLAEDIVILEDIGGGCGEEAVRIIKNSPPWIPAKSEGKPVKVQMKLPMSFKYEEINIKEKK